MRLRKRRQKSEAVKRANRQLSDGWPTRASTSFLWLSAEKIGPQFPENAVPVRLTLSFYNRLSHTVAGYWVERQPQRSDKPSHIAKERETYQSEAA